MPARRRYISPTTHDYVVELGSPREDDGGASRVVFLLSLERGSCAVDPEIGSRLWKLKKLDPSAPRLAREYSREALADLVAAGVIRNLVVEASATDGRLELLVSYRDRSGTERRVGFTQPVGV